ncbi:MAG: Adenylate kinase [uncultured bacterium]|nr:MAG: Adenylate kinase [uncultured bacterium]
MTKYKSLLFFGAPGCGKGTQGQVLGGLPGCFHLAMGDVFRSMDKESELGKIFTEYSSSGRLVPDELVIKIWAEHMEKLAKAGKFKPEKDILILDGLPRTVEQAEVLKKYITVIKVIHINCDDKNALVKRIQNRAKDSGRADDAKEDVIRNRLAVYEKETYPVLEKYSKDSIANIDGLKTPMQVLKQILDVVVPLI